MQSTATRRAALTGAALASDADAELLELERQLEALLPSLSKAMDANREAHQRAMDMLPPHPPGLEYCIDDRSLGLKPPGHGFWNKYDVEDRRAEGPLRAEAEARLDEVLAIEQRRKQQFDDVGRASGWDEASNEEERYRDRGNIILARAAEIEPQTVEGVAIQARFIAWQAWHLLFEQKEKEQDWAPLVTRRFIAAMMRLGGRDFLPRPWAVVS